MRRRDLARLCREMDSCSLVRTGNYAGGSAAEYPSYDGPYVRGKEGGADYQVD